MYTRRGDALATLRKLQAEDRAAMTAAGRRRKLERYAPELLDALRRVYEFLDTNYDDSDMPDILPDVRSLLAILNRD
jgi:hypothetical protein